MHVGHRRESDAASSSVHFGKFGGADGGKSEIGVREAISPATYPPLNPASILTATTLEAQQVSIDSIAVIPWSDAP